MRTQGNILNVFTYNTGDFLAADVSAGAIELPLVFALDFEEGGGEAMVVTTDQVVNYTGFDAETQVLYLDPTTPLATAEEAGTKIEVLPFSPEKRAVVDTGEGFEPFEVRVPHNLKAVLADGIRSKESGYEPVSVELDGGEWVITDIRGTPAVINTDAITSLPPEVFSDGEPPIASPAVTVAPLGVGALQGTWIAAEQPDSHDPVIYDVYVSATTPVVADADHFLTSTAGTSQSFSKVNVGGVWVPISISSPSYMAVWARDSDGMAPSLGGEGSGTPRKADIDELNVGQLNAETIETLRAWAGTVDADFIFTNNYVMIGDVTGSHIEINPAKGLILFGPNGVDHVVKLDMTAAQLSEFTGKINTNQLAVFDSLEISGILSRIMSAALLTIGSSTIAAPTSVPTLGETTNTRVWPLVPSGFTETGLYWDGTDWNRTIYNSTTFVTRIQTINAAASAISDVTLSAESADRDARGLTKSGGYTYTIRRDNAAAGSGKFYLKKYNADGTPVPDTGAAVTLTYADKYGVSSPYEGGDVDDVRVDSSNVIHILDNDMIRRFNTSGTYLGQTPLDAVPNGSSTLEVDSSGNYYTATYTYTGGVYDYSVVKLNSSGTAVLQFGTTGTGDGQFTSISGIRLDGSGNIYVIDSGADRIQKFNSSGVYQSQFGGPGTGNGQFSDPQNLNFDSSGNIYVVDYGNHRIQKFNSSGVYQSQFGGYGGGSGLFTYPVDIDFDTSGNIYVADAGNYVVQKFNSSHVFQSEFGYGDHEESPVSISLDSSNNVYTAEDEAAYINKFNSSGVYQTHISNDGGTSGDAGMDTPHGIAIDSVGNIWVADTNYHRIKKFNSAGVWQTDYGTLGTGNGQFHQPHAIAIDSSDNIYVADTYNHRIQKFNSAMTWQWSKGVPIGTSDNDGEFLAPEGVAVDSAGNVYVSDSGHDRIQKLAASTGSFQTKWGTLGTANGQFSNPVGIAADSTHVYVVDRGNNRLQKFTNTGTYVSKTGTYGSGSANFSNPAGVTVDGGGNLHVADLNNRRIKKYNNALVYQSEIDANTVEPDNWFHPRNTDFDASGNMYIIDSYFDKIFKYTGQYPPLKTHVATELDAIDRVQPTLGWDSVSSNLVVGCCDTSDLDMMNGTNAGLYRYSPSTLAYVSAVLHSGVATSNHKTATFCGIDNFDYGGPRAILASDTTVRVYTYSGSAITADTSYPTWIYDGSPKAAGWDGVNFYSAADTTALRRYSTFKANPGVTNQRRFWAQYQWEDVNEFGTLPSPKTSFDLTDRRWLNITVPTPGAGTGYTRIFTGNGTSTTNSTMYGLANVLATTGGTVQTAVVLTSGTNPKTVSDIPTGAAGRLEAQTGTFKVNGDSGGTWHEKAATPRFVGRMTAATQSIANSTNVVVELQEDTTNSTGASGYWSWSDTTDELTILKAGWWDLYAMARFASSNTTGARTVYIYVNGTAVSESAMLASASVVSTPTLSLSLYLGVNDLVTIRVRQTSGGAINIQGGSPQWATRLHAIYAGPAAV